MLVTSGYQRMAWACLLTLSFIFPINIPSSVAVRITCQRLPRLKPAPLPGGPPHMTSSSLRETPLHQPRRAVGTQKVDTSLVGISNNL